MVANQKIHAVTVATRDDANAARDGFAAQGLATRIDTKLVDRAVVYTVLAWQPVVRQNRFAGPLTSAQAARAVVAAPSFARDAYRSRLTEQE